MKKFKILYVEDDQTLAFVTRDNLELHGYQLFYADSGKQAIHLFESEDVDLVILDIMLPDLDGFAIAQHIRDFDQQIPILFLSAKTLLEDRLKGLELGADDYLVKPFSIKELLLKIEIFLKRSQTIQVQPKHIAIGSYLFSYKDQILQFGEEKKILTQRESELIHFLSQNINTICKREDILKSIWGDDDYFLGRSLDVFISRLRKYLKKDNTVKIENIHGVGFSLKVR